MPDTLINIRFIKGTRAVKATRVSDHVFVHRKPDTKQSFWRVSDPVSGRRYPVPPFKTKRAAIAWAKTLISKFGDNPLSGGVLTKNEAHSGEWAVKPDNYEALKVFLRVTVYGN